MTRKSKIRIAVVVVVSGALVWAVWPGEDEGAVSVTYAGVSANDSNTVVFTITNSSKNLFYFQRRAVDVIDERWHGVDGPIAGEVGSIIGRSATNYETMAISMERWRVQAASYEPIRDSSVNRTRMKLWEAMQDSAWARVSRWVCPQRRWKYTYGPEMLGNKPVAVAEK